MRSVVVFSALVTITGCSSIYYGTMEKFGVHKRDIMVDRVEEARDAQQDAKKQFANALEQFKSVVNVKGGDLEAKYNKLNAEYERSVSRAQAVHDRIAAVENVSDALFSEWKSEIKQYDSDTLRRSSQQKLDETKAKYNHLIAAMKKAAARIDPVLKPLHDQVLFLKHNLNAQAIASLNDELISVQTNVDSLVKDMESAIAEADAFIKTMQQ
jgi:hypothetical protein